MEITLKQVYEDKDLQTLETLAKKIWNIHYPPIIGQTQVDYMLDKFYSIEALKKQIHEDHNIFLCAYDEKENMMGFLSYSTFDDKNFFIHKWYVDPFIHGKGIGRKLFSHIFDNTNFSTIRLTVNRQNIKTINFYFKLGFTIEKVVDIDIGEGYIMDDFQMIMKKN